MKRIRIDYRNGYCEVAKPKTVQGYKALVKIVKILLSRDNTITLRTV